MKIKKLLAAAFFCAAILCAMSVTGFAEDIIVDSGNGQQTTYTDLATAVEAAPDGSTVTVPAGEYTLESKTYNSSINGSLTYGLKFDKSITLKGAQAGISALDRTGEETVLKSSVNGYNSGMILFTRYGVDVTIDGFTFESESWDTIGNDDPGVQKVNIVNNIFQTNGQNTTPVKLKLEQGAISNNKFIGENCGYGVRINPIDTRDTSWTSEEMPDEFNIDIAIESNDFSGITLTDTMRGVIDLNTGETTGAIKVANNDFSGINATSIVNSGKNVTVESEDNYFNVENAAELQAAIDAASEGDTINLASGTYDISAAGISINKPIILKGVEGTEIIGSICIQSGDVTIDGLKFTSPVKIGGEEEPVCIFINTVVAPATSYDNITITNCDFTPTNKYTSDKGSKYKGIVTSSAGSYDKLQITNNTFGNLETAIHINPSNGSEGIKGVSNLSISGNTSNDTNGTFAKLESVQTATITNNEISAPIYVRPDWNATNPTPSTNININENAFLGGNAVINVDKAGQRDGFDISANYWENIEAPSPENCVKVTYQGGSIGETVTPTMTSYYTNYIDGELSNLVKYVSDSSAVDKKVTFKQLVDEATGKATNQFYVYLEGSVTDEITEITEPAQIKDLVAVDVKINVIGAQIGDSSDKYSFAFESFEVADDRWQFHLEDGNRFLIYQKGDIDGNADLSGEKILLGTLTLGGYGEGTLKAEPGAEENTVEQRSDDGMNLVKSSMLSGEEFPFEIKAETATLNVKVQFNNEISDNPVEYQQMWAEITGGTLTEPRVIEFGDDSSVVLNEDSYSFTCNDLIKGRKYTVAIKGEGYRTAHYTVTMDADEKNLSFWNNVKDAATVIETGADESTAVVKNYLAGDILKDNVIDIYDLSAVVSYFGEEGLNVGGETYNKGYAKYDLNRDGKIDSKDVAMVLVSWGK